MSTTDKHDLVQAAAGKSSLTKSQLSEAVDALFEAIVDALAGGNVVVLRSFGRFYIRTTRPYEIKKARSGIPHLVESHPLPVFRSSAALRRRLRNGKKKS